MMKLINRTQNDLSVANHVIKADSFISRGVGLIGKSSFPANQAMWFSTKASSGGIHTWFMRFPIDVIYADKNLQVTAVFKNVRPWRWLLPVWRTRHVFELAAGQIAEQQVNIGDKLYVGD